VKSMKRLLISLILILQSGLLALPSTDRGDGPGLPGQTPEEEILSMMKSREASIKEILGEEGADYTEEQRTQLRRHINDVIDFAAMSRTALDRHWNGLSAAEQSEFVSTFSQVVRKSSLKKLDIFHAVIAYNSVEVEGGRALVKTIATYQRTKTAVDYRLHRVDDTWRVTDFLIDEVSTAESYRESFQRIIRKHTFQGLTERLRKKLEEE